MESRLDPTLWGSEMKHETIDNLQSKTSKHLTAWDFIWKLKLKRTGNARFGWPRKISRKKNTHRSGQVCRAKPSVLPRSNSKIWLAQEVMKRCTMQSWYTNIHVGGSPEGNCKCVLIRKASEGFNTTNIKQRHFLIKWEDSQLFIVTYVVIKEHNVEVSSFKKLTIWPPTPKKIGEAF